MIWLLFLFFSQAELTDNTPTGRAATDCQSVIQSNQNIMRTCEANWSRWGIERPPEEDLLNVNDCSGNWSDRSDYMEFLAGYGDELIEVPMLLITLAGVTMANAVRPPHYQKSLDYLLVYGGRDDFIDYQHNEFFRSRCGLAPYEVNDFVGLQCPTAQSHINSSRHRSCVKIAMHMARQARACFRSSETRTQLRNSRATLEARALQQFEAREAIRQVQRRFSTQIQTIQHVCRRHARGRRRTDSSSLDSAVPRDYRSCVMSQTNDNEALRGALLQSSYGLVEQFTQAKQIAQCLSTRLQKKRLCKYAMLVVTGTGGSLYMLLRRAGTNSKIAQKYFEVGDGAIQMQESALESAIEAAGSSSF